MLNLVLNRSTVEITKKKKIAKSEMFFFTGRVLAKKVANISKKVGKLSKSLAKLTD